MIPVSSDTCQDQQETSWQSILQNAISDPQELSRRLALAPEDQATIEAACRAFPLKVPEPYLARMATGDPRDPLLLQVLPQAQELAEYPGFVSDPLAERAFNPVPGLIHKYASRVLLITTSLCAVHCRYCFRREFPYEDNRNSRQDWQRAIDYIHQHSELNEVILSGGDPLSLPDRQLAWLAENIAAIPHIRRLRIHTRLPVVIPQRITTECVAALTKTRLQIILVTHCNHPNELDSNVCHALKILKQRGITLLNQSVMLAGVNDCPDVLAELSERLFAADCLPYYLHMLDQIRGSHHFLVTEEKARKIYHALQGMLPGFLVPRLVKEEANHHSKSWLV